MSLNDCTPTGESVCFATLANSQRMVCISDDFNLHQLFFHFRESSKTHIAHPCFFFFFLYLYRVYLQAHQANFYTYTEETKMFATQKLKQAVKNLTRLKNIRDNFTKHRLNRNHLQCTLC